MAAKPLSNHEGATDLTPITNCEQCKSIVPAGRKRKWCASCAGTKKPMLPAVHYDTVGTAGGPEMKKQRGGVGIKKPETTGRTVTESMDLETIMCSDLEWI